MWYLCSETLLVWVSEFSELQLWSLQKRSALEPGNGSQAVNQQDRKEQGKGSRPGVQFRDNNQREMWVGRVDTQDTQGLLEISTLTAGPKMEQRHSTQYTENGWPWVKQVISLCFVG